MEEQWIHEIRQKITLPLTDEEWKKLFVRITTFHDLIERDKSPFELDIHEDGGKIIWRDRATKTILFTRRIKGDLIP